LEKYGLGNAEELFKKHGTHPNRDIEHGIFASSGSLGHGIGIAVGMAFLNRNRNVFVMTSDGECTEGSVWEALRIARDNMLMNLRIIVIANGFGANGKIDTDDLRYRLNTFYPSPACQVIEKHLFSFPEYLQGLEGHYVKLDKEKYECIQKY
jgi:transketolase